MLTQKTISVQCLHIISDSVFSNIILMIIEMHKYILLLLVTSVLGQDQIDINKVLSFITPREGKYPISQECLEAGNEYLSNLGRILLFRNLYSELLTSVTTPAGAGDWASLMFDSSANIPGPGVLSDRNIFHHPAAFSGCLKINKAFDSLKVPCILQQLI